MARKEQQAYVPSGPPSHRLILLGEFFHPVPFFLRVPLNNKSGHVCWDEHDLVDGRPTGLVRVSLGWMSTWEDAAAFVRFVRTHFVVETPLQVK